MRPLALDGVRAYYESGNGATFGGEEFNVYCDESCHLEHDRFKAMSLGAVWCPKSKVREISKRLVEIKARHGVGMGAEVKWTKVSPCNYDLYVDIIDYFFDDDDLHFRGLVVPDNQSWTTPASTRTMTSGTTRCTSRC